MGHPPLLTKIKYYAIKRIKRLNLFFILDSKKYKFVFMKKVSLLLLVIFLGACGPEDESQNNLNQGEKMLLMGNSFFRPYAEQLNDLAIDAGFVSHNAETVFRGGENGRPINFWNDSESAEHQAIKAILNQGNIDVFGMTAGHDPENPIEGHKAWIEYALERNPDITVFISIPPIDYPALWSELAQENGFGTIQEFYEYGINQLIHNAMVDQLRAEFPSINIFTIPTGWATINLAQMQLDDLLLDEIELFGPKPSSIFTDSKGHQGQIVIETGGLLWLNAIYDVDLQLNNYETGFNTNLHQIAIDIAQAHDPAYRR